MRSIAFIALISFLVSGCAAMFHGTKETLYLRSEEEGTTFFINGREVGKGTSAVAAVTKKEMGNVTLRSEKKGCQSKSSPVQREIDLTTLLGFLLDYGIISIVLIDWGVTGAIMKASQTDYILTPECPQA